MAELKIEAVDGAVADVVHRSAGEGQHIGAVVDGQIHPVMELLLPVHRVLPPAEGRGDPTQGRCHRLRNPQGTQAVFVHGGVIGQGRAGVLHVHHRRLRLGLGLRLVGLRPGLRRGRRQRPPQAQPVARRVLPDWKAAEEGGLGPEQRGVRPGRLPLHGHRRSAEHLHPQLPQGVQDGLPLGDRTAQLGKGGLEIRIALNHAQHRLPGLRQPLRKDPLPHKHRQKQGQTDGQLGQPPPLPKAEGHACPTPPPSGHPPLSPAPLLPPLLPLLIGRIHRALPFRNPSCNDSYADGPAAMRRKREDT